MLHFACTCSMNCASVKPVMSPSLTKVGGAPWEVPAGEEQGLHDTHHFIIEMTQEGKTFDESTIAKFLIKKGIMKAKFAEDPLFKLFTESLELLLAAVKLAPNKPEPIEFNKVCKTVPMFTC